VRVGVQSPGVLRQLHVKIGDSVKRQQLIAELESRSLHAKIKKAQAMLLSAEANLRFITKDAVRTRQLVTDGALSPSELDRLERELSLAEASVADARANVAVAHAEFDDTQIRAPIDGVVASIATREGETIATGLNAETLLTLIDLRRLQTWAYVDETDIGRIKLGQLAHFTVDSYPDRQIEGKVVAIYPKPEIRDNVVDYVVVVGFTGPEDLTLRPEMTANVKIVLERRENVLTIPRRALRRELGRSLVMVPTSNGSTRRFVTPGGRDDVNSEIIEGLREGEAVLLGEIASNSTSEN
jgi:macrolide-specific efflux system membrane fusion protein